MPEGVLGICFVSRNGAMLIDDFFENIWFALFICYGAPALGAGALTLVDDTGRAGHMNDDYSPLTVPMERDNVEAARLLILKGADVGKKDEYSCEHDTRRAREEIFLLWIADFRFNHYNRTTCP